MPDKQILFFFFFFFQILTKVSGEFYDLWMSRYRDVFETDDTILKQNI